MPIQIPTDSRFRGTQPVIKDGNESFGLWRRPEFLKEENLDDDDTFLVRVDQTTAGRPDLIAFNNYGSAYLEWVVIMFNRPQDPLGWPPAGLIIRLPRAGLIRALI
jgi:hypothetical protein